MGFGGNLVQGFRAYALRAVPSFPQIALWGPSLAFWPQPFQIIHCRKIFLRICCTTKVQIQKLKKLFKDSVLYVSESKSNIDRPFGYSCLSSGNFVTKAWSLCLTRAHLYCICARNGQTGLVQSNHVCDNKYTWFYHWEKIFTKTSLAHRLIKLYAIWKWKFIIVCNDYI